MKYLALLLLMYLAVLVLLAVFQRKLLYLPSRHSNLAVNRFTELTGMFAGAGDLQLSCDDGTVIRGWLLQHAADRHRPLVLFFHGNGGDRSGRIGWYRMFHSLQLDVLAIDYHGYGDSGGSPSETALRSDAAAAWTYATKELGYRPDRIIVMGVSLGGAVAVHTAASRAEAQTPAGLIVVSSFSSMADASAYHYPWVPVRLLLRDRYPSEREITALTCPYLQLHGDRDQVVPMALGEQLFAAAPSQSSGGVPKRWVVMPDTDHNDLLYNAAQLIRGELQEFVGRCTGTSVPPAVNHGDSPDTPADFQI